MRKIFSTLKSVVAVALVAAMTLSVSCSYDDTGLKKEIENVKAELAALQERVTALENKLNSEVESLKALIDGQVVVVDIIKNADGSKTIKLSDGEEITVLPACDHECTPCDCPDALQYRVVDGVLEVSADGENWIAVQAAPECVVAGVVVNEDGTVTITLATGEEINVGDKAELIECEAARSGLYVLPGETKEVALAVNDAVVDINIMNQPFGWSASVEEAAAPEAGDQGGVDPMPLAAGGKNYVVKVNGPAATLKEAAKSGVVSIHFNTAAGACKVLSINVNLAELTLSVDAAGNVTVANSIVTTTSHPMMGTMTDFADFHIGIVDAEDYATYGDHIFAETFYEEDWEYKYRANVASTMRSSGFFNVIDEPMWYEDGVCEKESYTLTVDQLAKAFYPAYEFEMGKEYIIFVTTESEMINYIEHPILTNAAKASYKRVSVQANILEETITWNDATAEFTLAGYNYYVVGWTPVSDLQDIINNGMAEDLDSALETMISANSVMSAGAIVGDMNATVKLSELAAVSLTQWAPMLNSDTEYVFFVYPFNATTEMELYTHSFVPENLFNFGTFRTKALVQGSFDAAAEFELVTLDEKNVAVNATFSEDVVTVAYNWSETSYMDPEEAAAFILGDLYYTEYVTFDEYVTYLEASNNKYYGIPDPYYLCVLAINAAGEYAYVEYDVRSEQGGGDEPEPEVEVIEMSPIASAKFAKNTYLYLYSEDGKYCAVYYLYGIVDSNKGYLPAGEYTIGADYPGIYGYGYSYLYDYVTSSATHDFDAGGVMKVSEVDGAYHIEFNGTLNDGTASMEFVFDGAIENLILPSEYVEAEVLDFTPVRAEYDFTYDLYEYNGGDSEYAYWLYDANNNYIEVICHYNPNTSWNYVFEGKVVVNGETYELTKITTQQPSNYNCAEGEKYFAIGEVKFANNTVYSYTGQLPAVEVNYLGEGSTYAPGSDNQGGEPSEPEVVPEFVIPGEGATYTYDYRYTKLVDGLDANNSIRVKQDNSWIWDIKFNPGLTEIVAGDYKATNSSFSSADALEVDTYNGGFQNNDYNYIYPDEYDKVTTFNVQVEGDYYCITMIGSGGYGSNAGDTYRCVYIGKIK